MNAQVWAMVSVFALMRIETHDCHCRWTSGVLSLPVGPNIMTNL